jgi:dienelactone hydrolase
LAARFIIGAACCWQALLALSFVPAVALDLPFSLSKPAGDGPFPAVVLLHDCSGLGARSSGAPWRWSSLLTAKGYVTIWPDSFSTRGHPRGVCVDGSPPRILPRQRAADAYAALDHLRTLPYVDHDRIAVMGGSHGGSSTLATIVDIPENLRSTALGLPRRLRFIRAAAAVSGAGRLRAAMTAMTCSAIPAYSSRWRRC